MQRQLATQAFGLAARVCSRSILYVWVAVTAVAGISGPFGTFLYLDFPARLTYWGVIAGISILVPRTVQVVVRDRFPGLPRWQNEAISVALIVPILTALIWTLTPVLLGVEQSAIPSAAVLAGFVLIIAIVVVALQRVWDMLMPQGRAAMIARPEPRLMHRLSVAPTSEVLRLTGRDHLVEVATTGGVETIRMRFSDAIAEMAPVEGICTHRSHWVTRAAITGVEHKPGKVFLRLSNGDLVPVSRKYRPGLEAAGIV